MLDDIIEAIKKRKLEKQRKLEEQQKQLKEQERNTPTYTLFQLYVGKIGLYKDCEEREFENEWFFYRAKPYAIFIKVGHSKYRHLKSKQELYDIKSYGAIKGDYVAADIKPFQEAFPIYMRKNNLTLSTKVSIATIEEWEDSMNEELAPNEDVVDLFK